MQGAGGVDAVGGPVVAGNVLEGDRQGHGGVEELHHCCVGGPPVRDRLRSGVGVPGWGKASMVTAPWNLDVVFHSSGTWAVPSGARICGRRFGDQ
jgi:hypothetical protein